MTNRKNILILMHNDATQFIDIANQYTTLFDKNKFKVTVAYLAGASNEQTKMRTISEEILFLECETKHLRGLKITAIRKLAALCRREKYSIVVSHRYKPIYLMMCVSKICRIPAVVCVLHAMETLNSFSRKLVIAALARKNIYFAGVSDAVRNDLHKQIWWMSDKQVITLYNCIDIVDSENNLLTKTQARKLLNLPDDAFVLGTIGRLVLDKDQKNLIYAFAKIKSNFPQAKLLKLIIIGEGVLEQELKLLVEKLNLQNDIIFTGFVTLAQRYLSAFDIFILPSIEEAFGRVLLEAMIAKVPVIGTRIDGIPEVVGDAGIMVEARDTHGLSEAILTLANLSAAEFSAQGQKGYDRIKTHFSTERFRKDFWDKIGEQQ